MRRSMDEDLPRSANVVVIGGGIVGCSVAYHLVERGVRDVLLLERRKLTCGTTCPEARSTGTSLSFKERHDFAKEELRRIRGMCFGGPIT